MLNNAAKSLDILETCLSILYNSFDGLTKLLSDLYRDKFLGTSINTFRVELCDTCIFSARSSFLKSHHYLAGDRLLLSKPFSNVYSKKTAKSFHQPKNKKIRSKRRNLRSKAKKMGSLMSRLSINLMRFSIDVQAAAVNGRS